MRAEERIRRRVKALTAEVEYDRGDEETWHHEADLIAIDALEAIANGAANPRAIAREALRADELEFSRWYA